MLCTAWGFDHNFKFCDDKGCTCKLDLERLVRKIKLKIKLKKKFPNSERAAWYLYTRWHWGFIILYCMYWFKIIHFRFQKYSFSRVTDILLQNWHYRWKDLLIGSMCNLTWLGPLDSNWTLYLYHLAMIPWRLYTITWTVQCIMPHCNTYTVILRASYLN